MGHEVGDETAVRRGSPWRTALLVLALLAIPAGLVLLFVGLLQANPPPERAPAALFEPDGPVLEERALTTYQLASDGTSTVSLAVGDTAARAAIAEVGVLVAEDTLVGGAVGLPAAPFEAVLAEAGIAIGAEDRVLIVLDGAPLRETATTATTRRRDVTVPAEVRVGDQIVGAVRLEGSATLTADRQSVQLDLRGDLALAEAGATMGINVLAALDAA